jgi:hypothetical protein
MYNVQSTESQWGDDVWETPWDEDGHESDGEVTLVESEPGLDAEGEDEDKEKAESWTDDPWPEEDLWQEWDVTIEDIENEVGMCPFPRNRK